MKRYGASKEDIRGYITAHPDEFPRYGATEDEIAEWKSVQKEKRDYLSDLTLFTP